MTKVLMHFYVLYAHLLVLVLFSATTLAQGDFFASKSIAFYNSSISSDITKKEAWSQITVSTKYAIETDTVIAPVEQQQNIHQSYIEWLNEALIEAFNGDKASIKQAKAEIEQLRHQLQLVVPDEEYQAMIQKGKRTDAELRNYLPLSDFLKEYRPQSN